ncbi:MFS transporter [Streptomyces deccanensis]|uniref:MFS transporter n=1 Tax=Streptomyces deccanensis TaxID=424188 RepID=UPI001EFB592A|nr:MFS transporter [Streptomyces deccanensis]ULR48334.1 MHS family MFS transporter [Streptomyces deccanensis]
MSLSHANDDARTRARDARRVVLATFIGTTLEWYDFFVYALCAVLVFGPLYFPTGDPVVGQLGAMATLTVGFVARPLGGVIAGHFGDRIGRKRMLVVTLLIMGISTVCVGLVPTYAQIGVWAPALLVVLRIVQGLAMGGEWGGAVSMAIEHAPPNRRALYASAPAVGPAFALVLSNLVLIGLEAATGDAFTVWGWRIAFVSSVVLIVIGMLARRKLSESPLFEASVAREPEAVPVLEVLRSHGGTLLKTLIVAGVPGISTYIVQTYSLTYGTSAVGYSRSSLLWIAMTCGVVAIPAVIYFARLADRVGLRPVLVAGAAMQGLTALLLFPLFDSGNLMLAMLGGVLVVTSSCLSFACIPALLTENFPPKIRYTGISLAYQLGSIVGGGLAPIIATAIFTESGKSWLIGVYMASANVVALGCLMLLRKKPAWQVKAEEKTASAAPAQADGSDLVGEVPVSGA